MGLGPRLELRQSQQLVMTPQLQLAIKLLTLTNVELEAYIGEELDKASMTTTWVVVGVIGGTALVVAALGVMGLMRTRQQPASLGTHHRFYNKV